MGSEVQGSKVYGKYRQPGNSTDIRWSFVPAPAGMWLTDGLGLVNP